MAPIESLAEYPGVEERYFAKGYDHDDGRHQDLFHGVACL
jgi:hypothetical protein